MDRNHRWVLKWLAAIAFSLAAVLSAFAGEWEQDTTGWRYQEDNGSWAADTWRQINGAWYYFGTNTYMYANWTTPDGYQVDGSGAWVQNENKLEPNTTFLSLLHKQYGDVVGLLGTPSFDSGGDFWTRQLIYEDGNGNSKYGFEVQDNVGVWQIWGQFRYLFDNVQKSSYTIDEFKELIQYDGEMEYFVTEGHDFEVAGDGETCIRYKGESYSVEIALKNGKINADSNVMFN